MGILSSMIFIQIALIVIITFSVNIWNNECVSIVLLFSAIMVCYCDLNKLLKEEVNIKFINYISIPLLTICFGVIVYQFFTKSYTEQEVYALSSIVTTSGIILYFTRYLIEKIKNKQ